MDRLYFVKAVIAERDRRGRRKFEVTANVDDDEVENICIAYQYNHHGALFEDLIWVADNDLSEEVAVEICNVIEGHVERHQNGR